MIVNPDFTEQFVKENLKSLVIKENKELKKKGVGVLVSSRPKIYRIDFDIIEFKSIIKWNEEKTQKELCISSKEKRERLRKYMCLNLHDFAALWPNRTNFPRSWQQKNDADPRRYFMFEDEEVILKKNRRACKIIMYYSRGSWRFDFHDESSAIHENIYFPVFTVPPVSIEISESVNVSMSISA